jgi:hypothetical protein
MRATVEKPGKRSDSAQGRRPLATFFVGIDCSGNWVALDQDCRAGGLFVGQKEAVRFALSQNGNSREHILLVEKSLELDLKAPPRDGGADLVQTSGITDHPNSPSTHVGR